MNDRAQTTPPMEPIDGDGRVRLVKPHQMQADLGIVYPRVEVAVSDESSSFSVFYEQSRDRVGRALALTLGDDDLAAEAVDEAMARAFQRWDRVSRLENPAGWAYRVGLNVARSRHRRVRRKSRQMADRPEVDMGVSEPSIRAALAELPHGQRAVVVCRLLLGWSEAQTARALGIKAGTAKSRLHRALSALEPKLSHLRSEETP